VNRGNKQTSHSVRSKPAALVARALRVGTKVASAPTAKTMIVGTTKTEKRGESKTRPCRRIKRDKAKVAL
jgi:hypothetical protein